MKTCLFIVFTFLMTVVPVSAQEISGVKAEIITEYGTIGILLYEETPLHQENFIKLAKKGFFDNQLFHRVIKNFMIQGGDPNSVNAPRGELLGTGDPGYTIPAEFKENLFHKKGVLAAARQGDMVNPKKASSGSQFYIVQGQVFTIEQLDAMVRMGKHKAFTEDEIKAYTTFGGSPHLDGSYTVFGEVIYGLDIVDTIASVTVDQNNRPVEDVTYTIRIVE